jgi:hypothetical protein
VQRQWEEGKSSAWTAAQSIGLGAATNPLAFVASEVGNVRQHGIAGLDPLYGHNAQQARQYEEQQAYQGGAGLADPATYLQYAAPESKPAMVALGAYGGLSQLMSQSQITPGNLVWSALAGILWSGHIPGGSKAAEAVRKVLPSWDVISNRLTEQLYESKEAARLMQSAAGRKTMFEGQLQHILTSEAVRPVASVLKKAADTGLERGTYTKNIDTGEIAISPKQDAKTLQALLQGNFGVDTIEDLEQKLEDGSLSADEAAKLRSLIQRDVLRLPHDLVYIGEGEEPLRDPANVLQDIAPEKLGAAREAGVQMQMLIDHAHRGPLGNHEDPIRSVYRSLVGHNRAASWNARPPHALLGQPAR